MSRRRALGLTGLALAGPLAGCGRPSGGDGRGDGFPVTVVHTQGTLTLPAAPTRVVALGYADTQIAQALGAPIVGAVRSPFPDGNWPGVRPPLGLAVTDVPDAALDLDPIAAHRPDLILAATARAEFVAAYAALSRIAPVLSHQDPGLGGATRERLVDTVGALLGRREQARDLLAGASAALADFAAARPGLRGATVVLGRVAGQGMEVFAAAGAPAVALFAQFGMQVPAGVRAMPVDPLGVARVGPEDLGVLAQADVVALAVGDRPPAAFAAGRARVVRLDAATFALLSDPHPAVVESVLEVLDEVLRGVAPRAGR